MQAGGHRATCACVAMDEWGTAVARSCLSSVIRAGAGTRALLADAVVHQAARQCGQHPHDQCEYQGQVSYHAASLKKRCKGSINL